MTQTLTPAPPANKNIKKFNKATAIVSKVVAKLETIKTIESKEQSENAIVIMKDAKAIEKMIEDKRTEIVKPLNDIVKQTNEFAKGLTAQISTGIEAGKKAVLAFQKEEEDKALKLKVATREEQLRSLGMDECPSHFAYGNIHVSRMFLPNISDELWNETLKDTASKIQTLKTAAVNKLLEGKDFIDAFGSDEDKEYIDEQIQQASIPVTVYDAIPTAAAPSKLKGQTKNWKFKITDATKVPLGYMTVDEVKIRAAIARGERVIPGVEIFQEDSLTLR